MLEQILLIVAVTGLVMVSASFWLFFVWTLNRPTIHNVIERSERTVNRIFGAVMVLLGLRVASLSR